ncbi:MAG: PIN domain-containing protein [Bifidobacteriaceae bacterium]|jgi:PIN domain nuclease of toxin-antitoxin system|nr:PIN domain-containing protein [Bifidobacteriaceae bacterium]
MTVFDASALLAYLRGEQGAQCVADALAQGGSCGAANWSEVAQMVAHRGASWPAARAVLLSYPLTVEPVTAADAETAAAPWPVAKDLSLADRLCLALAKRMSDAALTADSAWVTYDFGVTVDLIR